MYYDEVMQEPSDRQKILERIREMIDFTEVRYGPEKYGWELALSSLERWLMGEGNVNSETDQ